ncbi:hypothetical protein IV498_17495 [Paenarthrobacter sp. Z7-10]|nr:hypothetical protein [Paenarthrobacter sp. Z7-10]
MRWPFTAEQYTARQRYRVPGNLLPTTWTGATTKRYSPLEISLFPMIYLRSTADPDFFQGESDCNHLVAYTSLPVAELALSKADVAGLPLADGRVVLSLDGPGVNATDLPSLFGARAGLAILTALAAALVNEHLGCNDDGDPYRAAKATSLVRAGRVETMRAELQQGLDEEQMRRTFRAIIAYNFD